MKTKPTTTLMLAELVYMNLKAGTNKWKVCCSNNSLMSITITTFKMFYLVSLFYSPNIYISVFCFKKLKHLRR